MKQRKKIYRLLIVVFVVQNILVYSQTDISNYKFIQPEFNKLYFSSDSSSFMGLFKKLDSLKNGEAMRVNMVHMGGSHVQGGIWSNTFLGDFQTSFGMHGGGYFTFPYKMAKTNSQPYSSSFTNGKWKRCRFIGKEQCIPIGMNGLSLITNDSANYFGVTLTKHSYCQNANTVKVYHNFNPSFDFSLVKKFMSNYSREDNRDLGYTRFTLLYPTDSVSFELIRLDTLLKDFILYGVSLENDLNPGFYLAGLGANGASSSSFLRCTNLSGQLATIKPNLVILSLGVNDTQSSGFEKDDYIEHYDSLIVALKKANPSVAIILTTTTDNFIKRKSSNQLTITARDAMFELMQKHNVAVWDLFTLMGGYKSMIKWNKAGLAARDKVHFTAKGYLILGHLMFDAVNKSYANFKNLKN